MDYATVLLRARKDFNPRIGVEVIIVLPEEHLLCTYLGLRLADDNKVMHVWYSHKYNESLECEEQISLPIEYAQSALN